MERITIHTSTYNRAYILKNVYESLKRQTNKNFEWIITDDGSTDETENLVKIWMDEEKEFKIIYNKLAHVGIPRALNFGVSQTKTKWFMMLDSDDYILPNTVELIEKWLEEIKDEEMIAGIGFAKCFPNGEYMKKQNPVIDEKKGYIDATHIERKKYNLDMDMSEVHRTCIFKKYPFRVWPGEEFAPEQLNYYDMALDGWKIRWRNIKLCVCEYLIDGMTKNNSIVKQNPMGYVMMYNQYLLIHKTFKEKFFDAIQMTALCFYAKNLKYLKETNSKLITIITFPIGIILGFRRKIQFMKLK